MIPIPLPIFPTTFNPMHPNEINAAYMQMVNSGQNGVYQLGGPMISIGEWRDRQLALWKASIGNP